MDDGPLILLAAYDRSVLHHLLIAPSVCAIHSTLGFLGFSVTLETSLRLLSCLSSAIVVIIAFLLAYRIYGTKVAGVVVSAMLFTLPGFFFHTSASDKYAFHALFSTLFAATLLHCASTANRQLLCATILSVCVSIAAASHLSGVSLVAAAFGAAWASRRWKYILVPVLISLSFFVSAYIFIRISSPEWFSGAKKISYSVYYIKAFANTSQLLSTIHTALSELFVYNGSAAVLAFAGMRLLYRTQRTAAITLVLAAVGYLGPCGLIGDPHFGGYFVASAFPLALLATPALRRLATSWTHAGVVTLACNLPFVIERVLPGWGLLGYLVAVVGVELLFRRTVRVEEKWSWWAALPVCISAAVSISTIVPLGKSPLRSEVEASRAVIAHDASVIVCLDSVNESGEGLRFWKFPEYIGVGVDPFRTVVAPAAFDMMDPESAKQAMEIAGKIAPALANGKQVWIMGKFDSFPQGSRAAEFMSKIESQFKLRQVSENGYRLTEIIQK